MNPILSELTVRAALNGWTLRDVPAEERPNGGAPWRYELTTPLFDIPIRFKTRHHIHLGLGCLEQGGTIELSGRTNAWVRAGLGYRAVGNKYRQVLNIKYPKVVEREKRQ